LAWWPGWRKGLMSHREAGGSPAICCTGSRNVEERYMEKIDPESSEIERQVSFR
jgi:hypothetical protein